MKVRSKIPYVNLAGQHAPIKDELMEAVGRVIDHGKFILGDEVTEFEDQFARLCGVRYAVGVNSGTDALIFALKALGIGPGDEVITTPNSFVASAGCIAILGARPVFVDAGEDYNLDPELIEDAITPQTQAILPIHLTGRPAKMSAIMEIARRRQLFVVEDCAQAVGAEYKGQRVGSFGQLGCFSLHPLKTLNACGDGGVLTTDDPETWQTVKDLRNIGLRSRDDCVAWSHNSRLDTLQAAILLVKLRYFDEWTERRRAIAAIYRSRLQTVNQVTAPAEESYERPVYHTFVIQADGRDELKRYLEEHGVGTAVHYPVPIHLQKAAEGLGYSAGSFPVTEEQSRRILSLPIYPELLDSEVEHVADQIRDFYSRRST